MKNDVKVHYPNNEICSDYQNNDNINNKRDENEINEILNQYLYLEYKQRYDYLTNYITDSKLFFMGSLLNTSGFFKLKNESILEKIENFKNEEGELNHDFTIFTNKILNIYNNFHIKLVKSIGFESNDSNFLEQDLLQIQQLICLFFEKTYFKNMRNSQKDLTINSMESNENIFYFYEIKKGKSKK